MPQFLFVQEKSLYIPSCEGSFIREKPVKVAVTIEVASIDAVSEENMDYTATIFLLQRWTDERLVFEGSNSITLDARLVELLWVPDTYIVNSKKSFLHDVTVQNRLVRLFSNGTVLYAIRITTTVACNMDLTKYPMDKQICTLQLESLGYNVKDLIFIWMRGNNSIRGMDTLQLAQYTIEQYYTTVSLGQDETGNYSRLALHFVLQRNMLYFILETYMPAALLVMTSWISFWIDMSSVPARTAFGVTTVLSMTTMLMASRSTFNCYIKAIDVYLGICFTFVFGALIEYALGNYCTEQCKVANNGLKKAIALLFKVSFDVAKLILNGGCDKFHCRGQVPLQLQSTSGVGCGELSSPSDSSIGARDQGVSSGASCTLLDSPRRVSGTNNII
ncbi:gamma-aminobutyric acid receptor subunit pi-like [Pelodytes ibericus]